MFVFARSLVLQQKLGNEGLVELDTALDELHREWKDQVLATAADRFERRLTQEISTVRMEMTFLLNALRP